MPWLKIVSVVGKEVAKQAIRKYGWQGLEKLGILTSNKEEDIAAYLKTMDRRLREIGEIVSGVEVRQVFQAYNEADKRLELLFNEYFAQQAKPRGDQDRQRVCVDILGDARDGVSGRARVMISEFLHKNLPNNKTFFEEYSDILARGYTDLYSYCARMEAVMNHLRLNLLEAELLRERCVDELGGGEVSDRALTVDEIQSIEAHFTKVAGPVCATRDRIASFTRSPGEFTRLEHVQSGNYLTGYGKGKALSRDRPFQNVQHRSGESSNKGTPQVFLYPRAMGQIESYDRTIFSGSKVVRGSQTTIKIKLDRSLQTWKMAEAGEGSGRIVFYLIGDERLALDGVQGGAVYLGPMPEDRGNRHMWWEPIMARNEKGEFLPGVFLLRHHVTGFALDGDGSRVYAEDRKPDYDNPFMRWTLGYSSDL